MEVFICTLISGLQSLAPARGQEKGDEPKTKNNLTKNKKNLLNINNLTTHSSLSAIHFFWVGGLVALGLTASVFLSMSRAHAADNLSNVELAKKVIKEVAPIVSEKNQPDIATASLILTTEDYIQKPLVVETQITLVAPKLKSVKKPSGSIGGPHYFPYGYCTYYVSQKRTITWSGNAGTWLKGAKSAGLKTGDEPQVGAIMVTSEGGKAGHVAYVEKVEGDQVTISEMNFKGFGVISSRTIAASSRVIKGYIY